MKSKKGDVDDDETTIPCSDVQLLSERDHRSHDVSDDVRLVVFAVCKRLRFACRDSLTVSERNTLELIKVYVEGMHLHIWNRVKENLRQAEVTPTDDDMKWMNDSIDVVGQVMEQVRQVQKRFIDAENEKLVQVIKTDIKAILNDTESRKHRQALKL